MATHRYWRAAGLKPYDGGGLVELSELWLLNGATRVDSGATLTSSVPPISGTLSNLQDANSATTATLAAGSTVTWDFGAPTQVTNIQVGAASSAAHFLLGCAIERSDDGVTWREYQLVRNWMGIRWPGPQALTANVMRIPPIDHKTIRMSFEPTVWQANEYGVVTTFGVETGASALTVSPIQGARSVQFTGAGRLAVNGHSLFSYPAGIDFTMQARVRSTATDGNRVVMAFGGISAGTSTAHMALNPATNVLSVVVTGTSTRAVSSPAGAVAFLNTARHVAASSENGTLRLFIDGVLVGSSSGANVFGLNSNPDVAIGNYGGVAENTFLGAIDEVGFDHKALYFSDFTPPAFIVPQPEWLIDAVTVAPANPNRFALPSAGAMPAPFISLRNVERGRYDYVLGANARGRVKGTTKDKGIPNVPVSERVRLYRMRDGLLIREVWSTPGTGAYSFDYVDEIETYFVISFDHDLAYRAVVADNLTLANGGVELIA